MNAFNTARIDEAALEFIKHQKLQEVAELFEKGAVIKYTITDGVDKANDDVLYYIAKAKDFDKSFKNGKIELTQVDHTDEETFNKLNKSKLQDDQILMSYDKKTNHFTAKFPNGIEMEKGHLAENITKLDHALKGIKAMLWTNTYDIHAIETDNKGIDWDVKIHAGEVRSGNYDLNPVVFERMVTGAGKSVKGKQ